MTIAANAWALSRQPQPVHARLRKAKWPGAKSAWVQTEENGTETIANTPAQPPTAKMFAGGLARLAKREAQGCRSRHARAERFHASLTVRAAPSCRGGTDRSFERAGKGGFGLIADHIGHLGEG